MSLREAGIHAVYALAERALPAHPLVLLAASALTDDDLDEAIRALRRLQTAAEAAEDSMMEARNPRANAEAEAPVRLDLADAPLG